MSILERQRWQEHIAGRADLPKWVCSIMRQFLLGTEDSSSVPKVLALLEIMYWHAAQDAPTRQESAP